MASPHQSPPTPPFAETADNPSDIRTLMPAPAGGSFTALLQLPASQALHLLHPDVDDSLPSSSPEPSPPPLPKRKSPSEVNTKGFGKSKRSKDTDSSAAAWNGDEKLPYVHVRARRGQATDSHSIAERARREKINARMKVLQDLVPGCSKVSGTALILDEIINHVQFLQRQVEYLSMRLAAVTPRVEFGDLEDFFTMAGNGSFSTKAAGEIDRSAVVLMQQQPWYCDPLNSRQLPQLWERQFENQRPGLVSSSSASVFGYTISGPVSTMHANQLKAET